MAHAPGLDPPTDPMLLMSVEFNRKLKAEGQGRGLITLARFALLW